MIQRYSLVFRRRGFPTFHEWHSWPMDQLNHYIHRMLDAGWAVDVQTVGVDTSESCG